MKMTDLNYCIRIKSDQQTTIDHSTFVTGSSETSHLFRFSVFYCAFLLIKWDIWLQSYDEFVNANISKTNIFDIWLIPLDHVIFVYRNIVLLVNWSHPVYTTVFPWDEVWTANTFRQKSSQQNAASRYLMSSARLILRYWALILYFQKQLLNLYMFGIIRKPFDYLISFINRHI